MGESVLVESMLDVAVNSVRKKRSKQKPKKKDMMISPKVVGGDEERTRQIMEKSVGTKGFDEG